MSKINEDGIVVGKETTVAYADDILSQSTSEDVVKKTIKLLENYLEKKIMEFGDTRGR